MAEHDEAQNGQPDAGREAGSAAAPAPEAAATPEVTATPGPDATAAPSPATPQVKPPPVTPPPVTPPSVTPPVALPPSVVEPPAAHFGALPDGYDPFGPDTAAIPALDPLQSTRELPAVREPHVKPFAVDSSLTGMFEPSPLPGEPPRTSSVPVSPVFAAHGATHGATQTQAPPQAEREAGTGSAASTGARDVTPRSGPRTSLVLGGLVLVLLIALAAWLLPRSGEAPAATPTPTATSAAPLKVSLSSMDPVNGSGFREDGDAWTTQTYKTAQFGNLKPGVGVILDLGTAQSVGRVTFTGDGFTAQLRWADAPSDTPGDWTPVGSSTTADGSTTLSGTGGGSHRYWLIWVTKLGSTGGGYSASVTNVQVTA